MTSRDLTIALAMFGLGAGAGFLMVGGADAPPEPTPTTKRGFSPSTTRTLKKVLSRDCPDVSDDDLEEARAERKQLELEVRMREGARDVDFGPALTAPAPVYEPDNAQRAITEMLTVGRLDFSSCDAYPCALMWDVNGADPEQAQAQLDAFREAYPDATTSWWQYGGDDYYTPRGIVPIVFHGTIDDGSADNPELDARRVRFISRMLKAEARGSYGPEGVDAKFWEQDAPLPL